MLILDDSPGDARLIELALSWEPPGSFRCARADRLERALERLGEEPFDAVVVDLSLPDGQGPALVRRVRSTFPELPILAHSGSGDAEIVRGALGAGAQGFLVKGPPERGRYATALKRAMAVAALEADLAAGRAPRREALERLDRVGDACAVVEPKGRVAESAGFAAAARAGGEGSDRTAAWVTEAFQVLGAEPGEVPLSLPGTRVTGPGARVTVRRLGPGGHFALLTVRPAGAPPMGPPTVAAPPAPISWEKVRELTGGDVEFLRSLSETFQAEAEELRAALETAAACGDAVGVERAAHRLKSTAAQIGADELAARARRVEALGAEGDLSSAGKALPGLYEALGEARAALARPGSPLAPDPGTVG